MTKVINLNAMAREITDLIVDEDFDNPNMVRPKIENALDGLYRIYKMMADGDVPSRPLVFKARTQECIVDFSTGMVTKITDRGIIDVLNL